MALFQYLLHRGPSKRKRLGKRNTMVGFGQNGKGPVARDDEDKSEKQPTRTVTRDFLEKVKNVVSKPERSESAMSAPGADIKRSPTRKSAPAASTTANRDKPLPPPPRPGSEKPAPKRAPPKKMDRIISPLSEADVRSLFSGAPQFFTYSEESRHRAGGLGAPYPCVEFPWDTSIEIVDLSDRRQVEHAAWHSATASPLIIQQDGPTEKGTTDDELSSGQKPHFNALVRERPNMLSMQGLELGTMGYQAALEVDVADALQGVGAHPSSPELLSDHRAGFFNKHKKHGLRYWKERDVLEQLADIGVAYRTDAFAGKSNGELYSMLFTQVLHPPDRVTDARDPLSLRVQIESLLKVLREPRVWVDFSYVEWRIRLGQILWGPPLDMVDDQVEINGEHASEAKEQKFWLLLQILVSCHLLIRLDLVTNSEEAEITEQEIRRFNREATPSMRWSLVLARLWLDNMLIEMPRLEETPEKKPEPTGWLASLTSSLSYSAEESKEADSVKDAYKDVEFKSLHQDRQLCGLIHFARKLEWPHVEDLLSKFTQLGHAEIPGLTPNLVNTPLSMTTHRTSYFTTTSRRPGMRRGLSKQTQISATVHPAGWLSRSYLSGLILPGEGISHFLIATILENDAQAVAVLGPVAELCGGFVYSGRSFWSISCVVGRVLAAGKGAKECMGWISSPVMPKGTTNEWFNLDIETTKHTASVDKNNHDARILHKHLIENLSSPTGDGDVFRVLADDFVLPDSLAPSTSPLAVKLEALEMFEDSESVPPMPDEAGKMPMPDLATVVPTNIKTFSAMMRFSVTFDNKTIEKSLSLSHDVHYATAHPCVTSPSLSLLQPPRSATASLISSLPQSPEPILPVAGCKITRSGPPSPTKVDSYAFPAIAPTATHSTTATSASHSSLHGHPLHKSFRYVRHPLSAILPSAATSPVVAKVLQQLQTTNGEVVVVDCPLPVSSSKSEGSVAEMESGVEKGIGNEKGSGSEKGSGTDKHIKNEERIFEALRDRGSDVELLARAWCAEVGVNALISRKGVSCVSCAVREARALGWGLVLRFA